MKNIINRSLTAIAVLSLLVSCTGRVVELPTQGPTTSKLMLKADTYAIFADGEDYVKFTVTLNGTDVTSQATIYNTATDEALPAGTDTFTATATGEMTFAADYTVTSTTPDAEDETLTSNSQTVKLIATGTAKKFYRNCGIFRFTGTWCAPCYTLGQFFNTAQEEFPERTVVVMAHVNAPDPYVNDASREALELLKPQSIPQMFFDFRDHIVGVSNVTPSTITTYMRKSVEDFPATSGIKASSTVSGTTATIDVEVTADGNKEYFLTVALIEDGIVGDQKDGNGMKIDPYTHNNTLRSFGETSLYGVSLGTIAAGTPATRQLTYDLTGYAAANCRFAIWVTYKEGDKYYIDNAAYCPVNGSIRYAYDA